MVQKTDFLHIYISLTFFVCVDPMHASHLLYQSGGKLRIQIPEAKLTMIYAVRHSFHKDWLLLIQQASHRAFDFLIDHFADLIWLKFFQIPQSCFFNLNNIL